MGTGLDFFATQFFEIRYAAQRRKHGDRRLHTVAKGDNHVEIVVANLSLHLTLAFLTLDSRQSTKREKIFLLADKWEHGYAVGHEAVWDELDMDVALEHRRFLGGHDGVALVGLPIDEVDGGVDGEGRIVEAP